MGLLRRCITKLVEVDERFGDREEEWGVVKGRWGGGCSGHLGELCVPDFFYVYGEGAVVTMVDIRGCDGSVCRYRCAVGGRRRSKWSSGEFVGMNVGVWGSPMSVKGVVLQNSSRDAR